MNLTAQFQATVQKKIETDAEFPLSLLTFIELKWESFVFKIEV